MALQPLPLSVRHSGRSLHYRISAPRGCQCGITQAALLLYITTSSEKSLTSTADIYFSKYTQQRIHLQCSKMSKTTYTDTNIIVDTIDDLVELIAGHRDSRSVARRIMGALTVFTGMMAVATLITYLLIGNPAFLHVAAILSLVAVLSFFLARVRVRIGRAGRGLGEGRFGRTSNEEAGSNEGIRRGEG